jgi:hypothetical protein
MCAVPVEVADEGPSAGLILASEEELMTYCEASHPAFCPSSLNADPTLSGAFDGFVL